MENVMDPSHVPFAHHGVQVRRCVRCVVCGARPLSLCTLVNGPV
jgi:hypothetical protein